MAENFSSGRNLDQYTPEHRTTIQNGLLNRIPNAIKNAGKGLNKAVGNLANRAVNKIFRPDLASSTKDPIQRMGEERKKKVYGDLLD